MFLGVAPCGQPAALPMHICLNRRVVKMYVSISLSCMSHLMNITAWVCGQSILNSGDFGSQI